MYDLSKMVSEDLDKINFLRKIVLAISKKTEYDVNDLWMMVCDKSEKELRKIYKKKKIRSNSAYSFFIKDLKNQNEAKQILEETQDETLTHKDKFTQMSKYLSNKWNNMDESDKVEYNEQSLESKKQADLLNGCKNKPKRKTCYQIFSASIWKQKNELYNNLNFNELNKFISKEWDKIKQDPDLLKKYEEESNQYNLEQKDKHNNLLFKKALQDEELLIECSGGSSDEQSSPFNEFKKQNKISIMKEFPELNSMQLSKKLNDIYKEQNI